MRLILACLVRRYGTLDTLEVATKDIAAMKNGDMRIRDDIRPGYISLAIRDDKNAKMPNFKPRLVV